MHGLRAGAPRREFERFVTDSADQLLRAAYLMARDLAEAEDLMQETLLRVARRWHKVQMMDHPAAYARRILVNLAIDGAEQRANRAGELGIPGGARVLDQADSRAERDLLAVDTQTDLVRALARLSPRQRAIIILRYWADLPETEVAEILGCSTGTVKSTASRSLARLREVLAAGASGHHSHAHDTQATS
jgi:RNA polymerase sigma-70 factor (sigma-E family)